MSNPTQSSSSCQENPEFNEFKCERCDNLFIVELKPGLLVTCPNCGRGDQLIVISTSKDVINHPPHYNFSNLEVITVIETWKLDFHLGNAIKYIARAAHKENFEQDLNKAIWYLQRRLQCHEKDSTSKK